MAYLAWLLDLTLWLSTEAWRLTIRQVRANPHVALLAVVAFFRSFGALIHTGHAGVLFTFGRARKVLGPGFHPLVPIVQHVRQTPIRSVTLDLPRQRVSTGDGLVYDVRTSIVYHVEDPILALTGIDDLPRGIHDLLPLLVSDLLREQSKETISNRPFLDQELTNRARQALLRWGVAVETAGLSTIAPTRPTVRLTQLSMRVQERVRLLQQQTDLVDPRIAIALVTAGNAPVGRSSARYHRRRRKSMVRMADPVHDAVLAAILMGMGMSDREAITAAKA